MFFYLLGVLVSVMLVAGQSLWKIGATTINFSADTNYLFSPKVFGFIFSPYIIGGGLIYVVATILYIGMLSKYQYSAVQALVLPASLIMAFIIARFGFHERVSVVNVLGIVLLLIGIGLATKK